MGQVLRHLCWYREGAAALLHAKLSQIWRELRKFIAKKAAAACRFLRIGRTSILPSLRIVTILE